MTRNVLQTKGRLAAPFYIHIWIGGSGGLHRDQSHAQVLLPQRLFELAHATQCLVVLDVIDQRLLGGLDTLLLQGRPMAQCFLEVLQFGLQRLTQQREATLVADHLVEASLTGHDSHGVGLLPIYVDCVSAGTLVPNRHAEVVNERGAVLVIEGNRGYGQVIGHEAMELGMARARQEGVALLALRNSFHLGRIGHWAEQCARGGFASIQYSILPLLWVLLGGAGTLLGPLVGTAAMFYLIDQAGRVTDATLLVVGAALLALVLFAPRGLVGTLRDRALPWLP